jgi:4-amino-4-deoxy-L-arabinose transferase-like glycosyltransferase
MKQARQNWILALAFAWLLLVYLGQLWGYPLQDPDEGRYAEIPREMLASGDWLTPRLNYVVYFEKPPLLYWTVAASFAVMGQSEGVARLSAAIPAILTVLIIFLAGNRWFGRRAGLLGAGVLATTPLFYVLGQALTIDMLLTLLMTATLLAFRQAQEAARKTGWVLAVAALAALGVLAKGPVALVLPGLVALCQLLLGRDWETLRALLRPTTIAVFLIVVLPWFVLVALANPEFLHFFFVREHFERFAADVGHPEGPFYYIPILLAGPLPWTAVAFGLGATKAGRAAFGEIDPEQRNFLLIWAGSIIVFFTAASSKLPPYVLPAMPPLALLLGSWLHRVLDRAETADALVRWLSRFFGAAGVLALVIAALAWPLEGQLAETFGGQPEHVAAIRSATCLAALAFGLTALLVRWRRQGPAVGAAVPLAILLVGLGLGLAGAMAGRSVAKTGASLAAAIAAERRDGDRIYFYDKLFQSIPFYLEDRIAMIAGFDEIKHGLGIAADRDQWSSSSLGPLVREWNSGRRVFVLLRRERIPEIEAAVGGPPRVMARDRSRVVLVNVPAVEVGEDLPSTVPTSPEGPARPRSGG